MATASASTFQDLSADAVSQLHFKLCTIIHLVLKQSVAADVAAANVPIMGRVKRDLGAVIGGLVDTLITVNADTTKRNAIVNCPMSSIHILLLMIYSHL